MNDYRLVSSVAERIPRRASAGPVGTFVAMGILAAGVVTAAFARPDATKRDVLTSVPHCQVLLMHDVDIPARETGLLRELHAERGAFIEQGALLGRLDDKQSQLQKRTAELERDAALARATDDIEVRYAVRSFELTETELNQSLEVNRKSPGTVPVSEIRRLQLARHRAELQIDRSELDMKVAKMSADVKHAFVLAADENIQRRQIIAPFDGTIIEVFREPNEWVNAGEPVLRIIRLDELSVDGFLSGTDFDTLDIADADVTVEVVLARGRRAQFAGRIVFVNPLIQAGNQFRVRAAVRNRQVDGHWLLRPGMSATMQIHRN